MSTSAKSDQILMQKRRTRLKKLHQFLFLLFWRTTSKKPSRFTQFYEVNFEGLLSIEMKIDFSLFRSKIIIFTFFTRVRHFCSKLSLRFHKISSKSDIFLLFSRNPIEKPSRLTPVGTKNQLLRLYNHLFSFFKILVSLITNLLLFAFR